MYDRCVNFNLEWNILTRVMVWLNWLSAQETQRMTLTIRLLIWDYEEIRFTIISDSFWTYLYLYICYTWTLQFSLKFISFLLHLFLSIWVIIRLLEESHWKYLIERKYHDYQKDIFLISVIEINLNHTNIRSLLSLFYKSYQRYLIKKRDITFNKPTFS